MGEKKGQLIPVPPDESMIDVGSGAQWLADSGRRKLVGMVIPSEVRPGTWRAAVVTSGSGLMFVCVGARGESLVTVIQVGTETFGSASEATQAVERNRRA